MSLIATIKVELREQVNPARAANAPRFFKAGPGEYAEGDKFIGISVPDTRVVAKKYRDLQLSEVSKLLHSTWHEERLTAIFILVSQFERGTEATRRKCYNLYLTNTKYVNNWDLVDSSASRIVGAFLVDKPERLVVLEKLAHSDLLWERRIAMISTLYYIVILGRADEAIVVAEILLHDKHDLIQKAVGWMLREVGKRVDHSLLCEFLDRHAATMPRTTLRYALEHFTPEKRQYYMSKKAIMETGRRNDQTN
ncbi:DNA alkylation repair protein [Candidatus Saccharibacteria bacterium]|nr:MAG: DNA alkylation repair protein [Candidatus Saccharibacteria bacterium]